MNILEEGPIPLQGKGYVVRSSENYGPGEFKDCQNLILTLQGTLKKRRPSFGLLHDKATALHRLIGTNGSAAMGTHFNEAAKCSSMQQFLEANVITRYPNNAATTFQTDLDSVSSLPAGPTYDAAYKGYLFEGFFRYADKDYLITLNIGVDTTNSGGFARYGQSLNVISMDHPANDSYAAAPTFPVAQMGASILKNIITVPAANLNYRYKYFVSSFLVHKERLFIAVGDVVYWSKATDPTKFATVDDGGFIRFPGGKTIKKLLAIGDLIYVIFDNSVNVLSYNTGPNNDLQNREISPTIGGEDAVVYGDLIYMVKPDALYQVSGTNVTKAMDLEIGLPVAWDNPAGAYNTMLLGYAYSLKAEVFDGHLYLINRVLRPIDDQCHVYALRATADNNSNTFVVNLENGFVSRFTYQTALDTRNPSDMIFVPVEDVFNQSRLVCIRHTIGTENWAFTHGTRTPFYNLTTVGLDPMQAIDTHAFGNGTVLAFGPIAVRLHVAQFSPDGFKYLQKKFRSVEIQLDVPMILNAAETAYDPELQIIVNAGRRDAVLGSGGRIIQEAISGQVSSNPYREVDAQTISAYRYGANQRATTVDVVIETMSPIAEIQRAVDTTQAGVDLLALGRSTVMEIVDIRTLWTPTRRGRTNDPNSLS